MTAVAVAKGIGRALLWLALALLILIAIGIVYLIIFPPFRIPETGNLQSTLAHDVTLRPDAPVAVIDLEVRHPPTIFDKTSSGQFDPTRVTVTSSVVAGADRPYRVRLYDADGGLEDDLSIAPDGRSMDWRIDCEAEGRDTCNRRYHLIVAADGLTGEVKVRIETAATLRFPPREEVGFLTWIHLGMGDRSVTGPGIAFRTASIDGAASVSPDSPAVSQPVSIQAGGAASVAGATLEVRTRRIGDLIPVDVRAPPPVRVLLVADSDASIVAEVPGRPGVTAALALQPLAGGYRVVVLWNDRAEQAYEVDWRLELGAVAGAPPPSPIAWASEPAPSLERRIAEGEANVLVGGGPDGLGFGIGIDLGDSLPEHLPSIAGVVSLELLLDPESTSAPVTLRLTPDRSRSGEEVLVVLQPGVPRHLTLEALGDCAYRCEPWRGEVPSPSVAGGPRPGSEVSIQWSATFEVWALDDRVAPRPTFYEITE